MLMGVGASTWASGEPGVERHRRHLDQEADHEQEEERLRHGGGDHPGAAAQLSPDEVREQDHVEAAGVEVDADQHDQQADGADERVEEELDRRVLFARPAPDADQEVHRQQGDFEEHVEQKEVERQEHAQDARLQEQEQGHVALGHLLDVPGGDAAQQADEGREDDQREAEPVDAHLVLDVERGDPVGLLRHLDDALLGAGAGRVGEVGVAPLGVPVEAEQQQQRQRERDGGHRQRRPPRRVAPAGEQHQHRPRRRQEDQDRQKVVSDEVHVCFATRHLPLATRVESSRRRRPVASGQWQMSL
jgi:hypothetical protein